MNRHENPNFNSYAQIRLLSIYSMDNWPYLLWLHMDNDNFNVISSSSKGKKLLFAHYCLYC
ncbi:hypothetical protein DERF_011984 [Dermatophagoides farinae]|uniref:Uncharacterized protein n=1 Tax=Dermatophagoides farinae TaxID=6954 RepID=A0A922HNR0_DERFA|nr:hypothetical protein DERF_011984 [Dermatophagoides farinae]